MARKKPSRKSLLKEPDEFLTFSTRAVNFFNSHLREIQYIGFAVGIVVIAYLAGYAYLRSVNKNAQSAYNIAYYTFTKNLKEGLTPEKLRESEILFKEVVDEYGLSKVARLALPNVAYAKFMEKKYDEAIDLYKKFLEKVSGNEQYESLAHLAIAGCYEAKGDLQAAIDTLAMVIERPDDPFREIAMFNLARLYRLSDRHEKEKETLNKFVEEYGSSPFAPMARARL
jgi:predicted negative regulator of RcsB-dependent stress response